MPFARFVPVLKHLCILLIWGVVPAVTNAATSSTIDYDGMREQIKQGEYSGVATSLEEHLQHTSIKSTKDSLHYLQGVLALEQRNLDTAKDIFLQLILKNKKHELYPYFHSQLARVYALLDDEKQMLHHYKIVISLHPRYTVKNYDVNKSVYFYYHKKGDKRAIGYLFAMFLNQYLGYQYTSFSDDAPNVNLYRSRISSIAIKIAYFYELRKEYNKALYYYKFSNNILQKVPNNEGKLASSYLNLAYVYYYLRQYSASEKYLQLSENYNKKLAQPKLEVAANILALKANILSAYEDYEQAKYYFVKARGIARNVYKNVPKSLLYYESQLGKIEYLLENDQAAIQHYEETISLSQDQQDKMYSTYGLALAYANISPKKSKSFFQKTIQLAENSPRNERLVAQARAYYQLALLSSDTTLAQEYHLRSEMLFDSFPYPYADEIRNLIASAEKAKNNRIFQQKIQKATQKCTNKTNSFLPDIKDILFPNLLIQCYELQGDKLLVTHEIQALEFYVKALQIGEKVKPLFHQEATRSVLAQKLSPIYAKALALATSAWKNTQKIEYFEQAFDFAEKSKAIQLQEILNEYQAIDQASIPDSLFRKGQQFRRHIAHLKNLSQDAKSEEEHKTNQEKIIQVSADYQDYILQLEQNFPKYYELKYNHRKTDVSRIKKHLAKDELIIEYSIQKNQLYIFALSSTQQKIYVSSIPYEELKNQVQEVNQAISHFSNNIFLLDSLGENLLKDILTTFNQSSKIIIIPDGVLHHFSFELLKYKKQYLIQNYDIMYHYSAGHISRSHADKRGTHLLTVAPTYKGNKYPKLPYAEQEITAIQNIFTGTSLQKKQASISSFTAEVPQHSAAHIAAHTEINTQYPLRSFLVFSESKDSSSNQLFAHQIYNMKLHLNMVALSACNAGVGAIQDGEGSMSLARGFAYAGCPTTVSTLWSMTDKSTKDIMVKYYKNLKKGLRKSQALRLAKLDYLQTCGPKGNAPFYWAGIVIIGSDAPLIKTSSSTWLFYLGGVLVFLVLLGVGYLLKQEFFKKK